MFFTVHTIRTLQRGGGGAIFFNTLFFHLTVRLNFK